MNWLRTSSWKVKPGKESEAVALLKELGELADWPGAYRVYASETGERPEVVCTLETEEGGDLLGRRQYIKPDKSEAFSAWGEKLREVTVPGSRRERIWREK